MASNTRAATEAEPETDEIADLVAQTRSLADRVAELPNGPRKQRLKSAVDEMQAIVDQFESDGRDRN